MFPCALPFPPSFLSPAHGTFTTRCDALNMSALRGGAALSSFDLSGPQRSAWRRFMLGCGTRQVIVLGGSMLAGHGCDDGVTNSAACAYPQRFSDDVSRLPTCMRRLRVSSLASGGTTSASSLVVLPSALEPFAAAAAAGTPTLLLVDFSINDLVANRADVMPSLEALARFVLEVRQTIAKAIYTCSAHKVAAPGHLHPSHQGWHEQVEAWIEVGFRRGTQSAPLPVLTPLLRPDLIGCLLSFFTVWQRHPKMALLFVEGNAIDTLPAYGTIAGHYGVAHVTYLRALRDRGRGTLTPLLALAYT